MTTKHCPALPCPALHTLCGYLEIFILVFVFVFVSVLVFLLSSNSSSSSSSSFLFLLIRNGNKPTDRQTTKGVKILVSLG